MARVTVLTFLLVVGLCGQAPPPPDPAAPIVLLEEAYGLAQCFPPAERADVLLLIARGAVRSAPEWAETWAAELLGLAGKDLAAGPYRAAMQKNALSTLGQVNPARAAELYQWQDLPAKPLPTQDFRTYGTQALFPQLWNKQGKKSLPRIRELATWLGSTGQYPYNAMAQLLPKVAALDPDAAAEIFAEAVYFFPRDPGFWTSLRQFAEFVLKTWQFPDRAVAVNALREAWKSAEQVKADRSRPKMRAEMTWAGGAASFQNEGDLVQARLLPLAAELDPDLAAQAVKKNAALAVALPGANTEVRVAAALVVQPASGSEAAVQDSLDRHRLIQAEQLAAAIRDPALRAVAEARLAAQDIEAKGAGLADLEKFAEKMAASADKVKLLARLAAAHFAAGREQDGWGYLRRAVQLDEELFAQDLRANPGKMAYLADGADEIDEVVRVRAADAAGALETAALVRQIGNHLLRARALAALAEALPASRKPALALRIEAPRR